MLPLVLTAACDGIDLRRLVPQHEARTRVATEPPGPNCEQGGKALRSGLDLNANGVLDDEEVTQTEYVCATRTPGVLVRTWPIAPGAQCPLGGQLTRAGTDLDGDGVLSDEEVTREVQGCMEPVPVVARVRPVQAQPSVCSYDTALVEAGVDLNGNGVLDANERRATIYLCANAEVTLLRQRPEPAGPNCTTGGTVVEAGVDENRNAALDDAEVRAATYVCQPSVTHEGTYVVEDAADLEALHAISNIRGGLSILYTRLTEVVLPGLVSVEGLLQIQDNPSLTRVELAGLRYLGSELYVSRNAQLDALLIGPQTPEAFPQVHVHALSLVSLPKLSSLDGLAAVAPISELVLWDTGVRWSPGAFPHLQELAGSVTVHLNPALEKLPLPRLATVRGSVDISANAALQSLEGLEQLTTIGGTLDVSNNKAMAHLGGPGRLTAVAGPVRVVNNDQLLDVHFEKLAQIGSLAVVGNPLLERVGPLPSLTRVQGDITLEENPHLLGVTDLPRLQSMGGALFITRSARLTDVSGLNQVTWMRGLHVTDNGALTDLGTLSALHTVGALEVRNNPALTRLHLDALEHVRDSFFVTGNVQLPSCWATMLADSVYAGPPGERFIEGNDSSAPCQP